MHRYGIVQVKANVQPWFEIVGQVRSDSRSAFNKEVPRVLNLVRLNQEYSFTYEKLRSMNYEFYSLHTVSVLFSIVRIHLFGFVAGNFGFKMKPWREQAARQSGRAKQATEFVHLRRKATAYNRQHFAGSTPG